MMKREPGNFAIGSANIYIIADAGFINVIG